MQYRYLTDVSTMWVINDELKVVPVNLSLSLILLCKYETMIIGAPTQHQGKNYTSLVIIRISQKIYVPPDMCAICNMTECVVCGINHMHRFNQKGCRTHLLKYSQHFLIHIYCLPSQSCQTHSCANSEIQT
jgi:hypothetical protein